MTPKELAREFFLGIRTAMTCPDVSVAEYEGVIAYKITQAIESAIAQKDAEIANLRQKMTQIVKWLRVLPRNESGIGANNPAFVALAEAYATQIEESHLVKRL